MQQIEIIPKIKQLCVAGKYNEAIELTNEIENRSIAIKAHLLCIEHELATNVKKCTGENLWKF